MTETSTHLPAAVIESVLEMEFVEIDRGLRYHGSSKMNMVGLASFTRTERSYGLQ